MTSLFSTGAPRLRDRVRASAENRPGVYWMRDRAGSVIYVGRSVRIRTRLLSYFRAPRDSKPWRVMREARAVEWRYAAGEFGARLEELRAIRRLRPKHNRQLKGSAGHHFLRLGPPAVPRLHVVRRIRADGSRYYGPFRGKGWLEETARILGDWAGLRTCPDSTPMRLADQGFLFGSPSAPLCARHELGRCLAPCAERCSEREYAERVAEVDAFLAGSGTGPLHELMACMDRAAAAMHFEYAGRLRDRIDRLHDYRALRDAEATRLATLTGAYPAPLDDDGRMRWYLIDAGRIRLEVDGGPTLPERIRDGTICLGAQGVSDRRLPGCPHAAQEASLVAAWFESRPEERARLIAVGSGAEV